MAVTDALPTDLRYVVSLAKRHADAIGFITTQAVETYIERSRVTLARENGDPCGFLLVGAPNKELRIFQACIQTDARNLGHGIDLVSALIAAHATALPSRITLHCRDGLASNAFWEAIGFSHFGIILGGQARRRVVNRWELSIRDALARPDLPYAAAWIAARARGQEAGRRSGAFPPPPLAPLRRETPARHHYPTLGPALAR